MAVDFEPDNIIIDPPSHPDAVVVPPKDPAAVMVREIVPFDLNDPAVVRRLTIMDERAKKLIEGVHLAINLSKTATAHSGRCAGPRCWKPR